MLIRDAFDRGVVAARSSNRNGTTPVVRADNACLLTKGERLAVSRWLNDDRKFLAVTATDREQELWKIEAWPSDAYFSADGQVLAYWDLNDRTFHLVDAADGKPLNTFRLPAEERKDPSKGHLF